MSEFFYIRMTMTEALCYENVERILNRLYNETSMSICKLVH